MKRIRGLCDIFSVAAIGCAAVAVLTTAAFDAIYVTPTFLKASLAGALAATAAFEAGYRAVTRDHDPHDGRGYRALGAAALMGAGAAAFCVAFS